MWLIRNIRLLFYLHTILSHKYLEKIQTQVSVQLETPLFLPAEDLEVANCNVPAFKEKKKKKDNGQIFWDHTCPPTPIHSSHKYLSSLLLAGHLFSSFHFLSFFFTLTHLISHTLPPGSTPNHHQFSCKITEKFLEISKQLHPFYLR